MKRIFDKFHNIFFLRENRYPQIVADYDEYKKLQQGKFCSLESSVEKWKNGQIRYIHKNFKTVPRSASILDIACGDGVGLAVFKKMGFKKVTGVEFNPKKASAAKKIGYPVYSYDMHEMGKFEDESFDVAYSSHTLEHAYYPDRAVKELLRILKNGGMLLVVLPYPDEGDWDDEAHGAKYQIGTDILDAGQTVKNFFESNGFVVEKCEFDSYRQPEIWLTCRKVPFFSIKKAGAFGRRLGELIGRLGKGAKKTAKAAKKKYYELNHLRWFYMNHYKTLHNREAIIDTYIKSHRVRKIQLGCGEFVLDSWLNTELYGGSGRVPLDLLKPFPIPSDTFDYVYSEHTIEHFSYEQGRAIMAESFRILKKGGKVRVTTPNLKFLIDLYSPKKTKVQERYIEWARQVNFQDARKNTDTFVINNFVRAWGHQFIYDFKVLKQLLEETGFTNVSLHKPGESKDRNLRKIESHWKSFSKEFNDLESICVEAVKR